MNGHLTAGGNSVHRIRQQAANADPTQPKNTPDTVPIMERYQDLAAAIHRTAVAPRGELFIWGCTCGAAEIVREPGLRHANMAAMKHVLDEASKLHDRLEGQPACQPPEQT